LYSFVKKEIPVGKVFPNGTKVKDAYSGKTTIIAKGKATLESDFDIVLLEKI
jgi:alpha-amylase